MQKRHPGEGGAVLLGGERATPNKSRPKLQATPAMLARLRVLRWASEMEAR